MEGIALAQSSKFPFKEIGDGKPATQVILTLMDGIAVDPEGNIYISHRSKNRIRKIDQDGIITTIAGNGEAGYGGDHGPALEASLNFPAGLCLDKGGNLYVADRNNHRVRKINPQGIITTVAGDGTPDWAGDEGPATEAKLNFPSGLACDDHGALYISDRSNNRIRKIDSKGIITTYVGLGLAGFGGDFGPAQDALLKYPFGIELDKNGNLFIADRGNNRVRKVDAHGIITTIAGDGNHFFSGDYGPATRASLAYPTGVAVDASGNLYIADRNNNRVRKVDRLGIITTFAGTGQKNYNGDNEISPETNLHLPFALAIDSRENLLVVDRSHFMVRKITLKTQAVNTVAGNGKSLFRGDGGPGRGANLESPTGIAIDAKGSIVIADKMNSRLRKIDSRGFITTSAGTGHEGNEGNGGLAVDAALYFPAELAIDKDGNAYFISPQGQSWIVRKIDAKGKISLFAGNGIRGYKGDGGPAVKASFQSLKDVAVDNQGNVYLADMINQNIRKIDKNGIIATVANKNWKNIKDEEIHPNGIVVDAEGNIFVSDSGSSKIRKIDREGNVATFAGNGQFNDTGDGGPAIDAGIRSPGGLALSPSGDLYIAEETSHRIRKIDKNGIISRVAGTGVPGFSGDGGPATQAQLKSPYRMVFDSAGNLYFTDRDNNRVRKIDVSGTIATIAGNDNIGWMQDGLEVRITVHNFP
ncbi:MAG: SMP-30/gluconolactonase/LRE family protein [Nitrospinae bacterium]|nr:SMP-30/gluconolactonase/LRE family protein [Nitrospinota bacterium]